MKNRTAKQILKDNKEIQRMANLLYRVLDKASTDGREFTPKSLEALARLQNEIQNWGF
jgi:hypothetical protein